MTKSQPPLEIPLTSVRGGGHDLLFLEVLDDEVVEAILSANFF